MENETLATELLRELKAQSKRWFVISVIELILIICTNVGWLIYNSQFEEITEQTTIDGGENGTATYLENSESGDIIYGENNKN